MYSSMIQGSADLVEKQALRNKKIIFNYARLSRCMLIKMPDNLLVNIQSAS